MKNEKSNYNFSKPTITLGIPTYNRVVELNKVLFHTLSHLDSNNDYLHFLVIDDHSSDDTAKMANCYHYLNHNFRLIQNDFNLGFQGNFVKLINEAKTDFIVVGTDDDYPVVEEYQRLHELLQRQPNVGIVSSLWYSSSGEISRGKEEEGEVTIGEFRRSCAHLPGTVFNVAAAKKIINDPLLSKYFLDKRNNYPQCMLVLVMLLTGYQGVYCPFQLYRLGFDAPSGISHYSSVSGRWGEYKVFLEIYATLLDYFPLENTRGVVSKLLELHEKNLFPLIAWGISEERNDVFQSFLAGAVNYASQPQEKRTVTVWL